MAIFSKKDSKIICQNCGNEVSRDAVFCSQCGMKIEIEVEEPIKEEKFYDAPFLHESDKRALKALKAIPGFAPLIKKFIKIYNEKEYKIINLSSNIRIDENQMPEIYNLLPPICNKLGIEIPELYLELDVIPNAYTYGDTNPFIVITSGLLETIPMELLPTVIAHECGHIACHHTLYTTIARMLINGANFATNYFGYGGIVSFPLQIALFHWMRCSELSADRAAAFYDGTANNVIEMCMRFAGYDKDLNLTISDELFMKQAEDYKDMIDSSKWDKTLEFFVLANQTHPFNAVRARECKEWVTSKDFENLLG